MKVLIVVKAYPALSKKYGELVCTAGVTEEGKWIRIYPIPFRKLDYEKQFKKFEWVEVDLVNNESDFRPESYRPKTLNLENIQSLGYIEPDGATWFERRKYVLNEVYTNLEVLINEAKNKENHKSLATFKPKEILEFNWKATDKDWSKEKLDYLKSQKTQMNLFEPKNENEIENFEIVNKLPYNFYYTFLDENNKKSTLMIEDWEIGSLFWNTLKKYNGNEVLACEDVKKKYFDDFAKTKDIYFFLGTRYQEHAKNYKNPFSIIGVFYPKPILQDGLF